MLLSALNHRCGQQESGSPQESGACARAIQVARLRQRLRQGDRSLRSPVEATVRSLKWGLRKDKLPVRGFTAVTMHFAVALMVNLRRIHAYLVEEEKHANTKAAMIAFFSGILAKIRLPQTWHTPFAAISAFLSHLCSFPEATTRSLPPFSIGAS